MKSLFRKASQHALSLLAKLLPKLVKDTLKKLSILKPILRLKSGDVVHIDRNQLNMTNEETLQKIRIRVQANRKIQVGFVVNEATKWNASVLSQCLNQDDSFDCRIFLTRLDRGEKTLEDKKDAYLNERSFFNKLGLPLIDLFDYESDAAIDINQFNLDVIFFQQSWGIAPFVHSSFGKSLGVYMHYGYLVYANSNMQYKTMRFHPYMWRYFAQSEWHRAIHLQVDPEAEAQIVVTGYPKLDVYLQSKQHTTDIWKGEKRVKVIYAPHHALQKSKLKISTFDWNYDLLLDFAKQREDISWIYRPHGKLKYVVEKNGIMTREEYEQYECSWDDLGNACTYVQGDYFDVFKSSDVLITDCGSFLGEYMPSGNPVIWMVSENPNVSLNEVGKRITDTYYKVHNREELIEVFSEVVINGNDFLKEQRLAVMKELFPEDDNASEKIKRYLKQALLETKALEHAALSEHFA